MVVDSVALLVLLAAYQMFAAVFETRAACRVAMEREEPAASLAVLARRADYLAAIPAARILVAIPAAVYLAAMRAVRHLVAMQAVRLLVAIPAARIPVAMPAAPCLVAIPAAWNLVAMPVSLLAAMPVPLLVAMPALPVARAELFQAGHRWSHLAARSASRSVANWALVPAARQVYCPVSPRMLHWLAAESQLEAHYFVVRWLRVRLRPSRRRAVR